MKPFVKIYNTTRETTLCQQCKTADTFLSRFAGLMGKASLPVGTGLLIKPCNSIHMFFMKFPIDAVFADKTGKVLHIAHGIKPWQVSPIIKGAQCVLELPEGTAKATGTEVGDQLQVGS